MRIGIDLMGSDRSPQILFDAVIQAAKQLEQTSTLVAIATREYIEGFSQLASHMLGNSGDGSPAAKIEFFPANDVIDMGDEPLSAFRHKKGSSLILGIKLLKKKSIDAFVTAGNTGALITSATLMLPAFPGIRRPALLVTLPTEAGSVAIVDVGGNVACKAHHLVQFAELGAAFQRGREGIKVPRVGLLNIGVESKKGTNEVRQAYQILFEKGKLGPSAPGAIQFVGNIEGRELFQGKVDVLVTDGFTGNVLLKTSEGVAFFILDYIKKNLGHLPSHQIQHAFQQLHGHFNYSEYPGAVLLGVDGVVIKCHGDSSSRAMLSGIKGAISLLESRMIEKVKMQLTKS